MQCACERIETPLLAHYELAYWLTGYAFSFLVAAAPARHGAIWAYEE